MGMLDQYDTLAVNRISGRAVNRISGGATQKE